MFFLGPEKCFSEHLKVSRNVSRYFQESFRVPATIVRLELERLFLNTVLLLQLLIFLAENCNCTSKINLPVDAVLKTDFKADITELTRSQRED